MIKDYNLTSDSLKSNVVLTLVLPISLLLISVLLFAYAVLAVDFTLLVVSCISIIASCAIKKFAEASAANKR